MIAADPARKFSWVISKRRSPVLRDSITGKETYHQRRARLCDCVDPETGNLWPLATRAIGGGNTVVFDDKGKVVATHEIQVGISSTTANRNIWYAEQELDEVSAATARSVFDPNFPVVRVSVDIDREERRRMGCGSRTFPGRREQQRLL